MPVVTTDGDPISIVVPGKVPRKNERQGYRAVVPERGDAFVHHFPSDAWKDWVARLHIAVRGRGITINRGAWAIRIRHYTDRVRHLDGKTLHVAHGDVDSATSAVLDGLQAVGVLDDDARFLSERATKHVDRARPRTEIELTPYLTPGPDGAQLLLATDALPRPLGPDNF